MYQFLVQFSEWWDWIFLKVYKRSHLVRSLGTEILNHQAMGCLVPCHNQMVRAWTGLKDLHFNDNFVLFYFKVAILSSQNWIVNFWSFEGVVSNFIANTDVLVICLFISVLIILWTGASVPCSPVHAQSDWSSWQRLSHSPKATTIQAVSSGGMQWKS